MLAATTGLTAGCLVLLFFSLAMLGQLQRRAAVISRVEAKVDLLLANAGVKYVPFADVSTEVANALRRGDKILAIKQYREATGVGLKEAKDYVEEVQRRGGI